MKRITSVSFEDFKGQTKEITLTGKDVFIGPTGCGKTTILDAIQLVVLGYHPRYDKKPMAIMKTFGSSNLMSISIQCSDGTKVKRIFESTADKYTQDIEIYPSYQEKGIIAKNNRITEEFGNFSVMFDISEFLSLSDDKKREFIFKFLPIAEWDKKAILDMVYQENINTDIVNEAFACWRNSTDTQTGLSNIIAYVKEQVSYLSKKLKESEAASRQLIKIKQQQDSVSISLIETLKEEIKIHREELSKYEKELATIIERNRNITVQKNNKTQLLGKLEKDILEKELAENEESIKAELEEAYKNMNELSDARKILDDISVLSKEHSKLQLSKATAMSEKQSVLKEIAENKKLIKFTENLMCPIIKEKCTHDFFEFIEKKKKEINKLEKVIHEKDRNIIDFQGKIDSIDKNVMEYREKLSVKSDLEKWINTLQVAMKTIADADAIKKELFELGEISNTVDMEKTISEIKVLIDQKQTKVQEAGKILTTLSNLEFTLSDRTKAEEKLQQYRELLAFLGPKGLQGKIIRESLLPLLDDINLFMGRIDSSKQFYVELNDEKSDKEIFELMYRKGNDISVPVTSLSSGESVIGYTVLIASLIKLSNPNGKYLFIDNIEHVSNRGNAYRQNFITSLDKISEGFDNIIVCGTEAVEPIEGWNIVDMYQKI